MTSTITAQDVKNIVKSDTILQQNEIIIIPENAIQNPKALDGFLTKLSVLESSKAGHINIVHIGDSHIQADLMTSAIRKLLQAKFGNGGRGFVFPHSVAKTNGSTDIKFSSNANWSAYRNIFPINGSLVGLSGIALSTKFVFFALEMTMKDQNYFFDNIKIIEPNSDRAFGFSIEKKIISEAVFVPKTIFHKIQKRETIASIAQKFNVSIADLKSLNVLKSDKIKRGKTLKIPTEETVLKQQEHSEFIPLVATSDSKNVSYSSELPLEKIYILPTKTLLEYQLNGLVLENNRSGILYHNIGVNGAKFMDYNKYPLFFEQLESLSPDLFIISLGTNESFGKFTTEKYMSDLIAFRSVINEKYPKASLLFTTPPPSLFQKTFPNLVVADYASKTIAIAEEKNVAVWNLHAQLGGVFGVNQNFINGLCQPDKVHYTNKGYELQGQLLFDALIKTYQNFKN